MKELTYFMLVYHIVTDLLSSSCIWSISVRSKAFYNFVFVFSLNRFLAPSNRFQFTPRSRDTLPDGFPRDVPGTCHFLNGYTPDLNDSVDKQLFSGKDSNSPPPWWNEKRNPPGTEQPQSLDGPFARFLKIIALFLDSFPNARSRKWCKEVRQNETFVVEHILTVPKIHPC